MPARPDSLRAAARRASQLVPGPAQGPLFRLAARTLRLGGTSAGLATLVVLCEEVDLPRLAGTLESVRHDAHAFREVLVVPVGAATAGPVRAMVSAAPDPRVRVLGVEGTWQDAANAGVDAARGRFVQLLRACDTRLPDALAALVGSLAESGSELATGAITQRGRAAGWLGRTSQAAHSEPARGIRPADRPALAGDLGLGNKLLRTSAWRSAGARFGPLDGWLLAPTMAAYLSGVATVDVLDRPVQEHLGGHGVRPFGSMPSSLRDLTAWVARADLVDRAFAGTGLGEGWRTHVLDVALPGFLLDAERASDHDWALLDDLISRYATEAVPDGRVESRVLVRLAGHDRRADVEALALMLEDLDGDVPTIVEGDAVLAAWPDLPADVPDDVRRLSETETPLVAEVHRWAPGVGGVRVDLLVRVDHVDLGAVDPVLSATLPDGSPVDVAAQVDAAATRWAGSRFHRAILATLQVPAGTDSVQVELAAGPLVRRAGVLLHDPHTRPVDPDPSVLVGGLGIEGGDLVVDLSGPGTLRLVDTDDRALGTIDAEHPRLTLRGQHFGRERWLPTGFYRLVSERGAPCITEDFVATLPLERVGDHHRLLATLGPAGGILLHLGPPLADDEQGPWAQQRLVESYAESAPPLDPGTAYFESYAGRAATDSPLGIHDALRRRRPDLSTYWGVLDHAQWVPEGATPILLRSRAHYDLLARAGCLVLNTDVEAWSRRRDGQVLLQTFHGYPSKGMGLGQWRAGGLTESRIAVLRRRGVESWSAILTPTPEMTRHYREQYAYDGPALDRGYPRNDPLVAPDADVRRTEVRDLLGIGDRTAVLYAPTWREHLAVRARRAETVDFLDVEEAARALGDRHVLLVRGHRFHQPRPASPRVIDVTEYPEVNDLILAADAAVLDYSSLRFDFALTGKPMVFLVPDLADYGRGTRAFLFPFGDSAPGPFVKDTAGVVAEVRDVAALRARWADRIDAFNAAYHPWADGRAADRVVDGLLDLLAHPTP